MLVFFLPLAAPASFAVVMAQERTGSYLYTLLILSIPAGVAAIAAFFLRETRDQHTDSVAISSPLQLLNLQPQLLKLDTDASDRPPRLEHLGQIMHLFLTKRLV